MQSKTEAAQTGSFHRDHPDVDPLRARFEVLMETWAELERLREVDGPSKILGDQKEVDVAQVMLMADVHQQASAFTSETLKICAERQVLSQGELDTLQILLQRLEREKELLQIREPQSERETDRER